MQLAPPPAVQTPFKQDWLGRQMWAHVPQLLVSDWVLAHTPPQQALLWQSLASRHFLPLTQAGHTPPPQSTSVSMPFCTPSVQVGSRQVPLLQNWPQQLVPVWHAPPSAVHGGAWQRPFVPHRPVQQGWPEPHGPPRLLQPANPNGVPVRSLRLGELVWVIVTNAQRDASAVGAGETDCQTFARLSQVSETGPGQKVMVIDVKALPGRTRRSKKLVMPAGGGGPGLPLQGVSVMVPFPPAGCAVTVTPLTETFTDVLAPPLVAAPAGQSEPSGAGGPAVTTGGLGATSMMQAPNVHGMPYGHWTLQPPQ